MISTEPITVKYDGVFTDKETNIMRKLVYQAKEKYRSLRNEQLDDLMQELAIHAYRAKQKFIPNKTDCSFLTFLYVVLERRLKEMIRFQMCHKRSAALHQTDISELEPFLQEPEQDNDYVIDQMRFAEMLPRRNKKIFKYMLADLTQEAIAKKMRKSASEMYYEIQDTRQLLVTLRKLGGGISVCLI
ncbi:RNA polymerase sigma factor sigma-70 family [Candidatus Termititenax aidoneus]|uniref:RNA polymerase sigma factor sigma-70 family n=1 Tax=Termititenax aidoneus TaxID=2218524 RepID=A0A388TDP6_TERA1|nr:RNA polymerase sigma factor sigma-70 family [Candidatus Termititenax aidoneus]